MLSKDKGAMGRNGPSVKTHSNDGDQISNQYCDYPLSVAKDLMLRETKHVNEWNRLLCNLKSQLHKIIRFKR